MCAQGSLSPLPVVTVAEMLRNSSLIFAAASKADSRLPTLLRVRVLARGGAKGYKSLPA